MRMFVAVRPPDAVIEDLAEYVEPRRDVDSPLRWSRPEGWHVTLAFLPNVADRVLDELVERLTDTAATRPAFAMQLAGAGAFPNPARAKLLWAGVTGELGELARLAGNVRSAAGRAGTHVEGGEFRPHLTLARINRPLDVTRWLRVFDLYASASWQVAEIVLFHSQLGGGPARYRAVETFPLGS
ncbi:MAG TPA: RNA 2',3'-cyclic phosphodiesterase [Jatrophihabitans sp.]|nr:RNA 2',3'-cyclic phosphodiesterase [Jatrophihabitans sp.]